MLFVDNISYKTANRTLLNKISFKANSGEFTAIIGANGAGKSTLIKCISQTILPNQGNIYWNNTKLIDFTTNEISKKRAVLTQELFVGFEFLAKEIIMMGRYPHFKSIPNKEDMDAVNDAIEKTHSHDFTNRIFQSLSGGEKQRIQIARVLAQVFDKNYHINNKLLLLDEPLNNLDIKHQHLILNISRKFAQAGNVCISVIHDINLAALYADKILVLKNGLVIAHGSPFEVITEGVINNAYDFPVRIDKHPYHHAPVVYFGCPVQSETLKTTIYDTQIHTS